MLPRITYWYQYRKPIIIKKNTNLECDECLYFFYEGVHSRTSFLPSGGQQITNQSENKNELKNIVKRETHDIPGIKIEQGLDVKLEPANVKPPLNDWEPKLEVGNITPKQEDVKDEYPENPSVFTSGSPTNLDDAMKPESEDFDSSLDFTLIDAGLIKLLIACNKPRPKPKPAPKKHKKSKKTKTKKSSKKSVKCTPLDRNIYATSKQLFEQLKNIKLEVKRENAERSTSPHRDNCIDESSEKPSALSSLDDLDIPDQKYNPETFESSVVPNASSDASEHEANLNSTENVTPEE